MYFKNHKCIFPADNSVYNRLKVGPKKNKIENDENGTEWEIRKYYVNKYFKFLPWITNWICSPYSTVEIIKEHSEEQNGTEQIVFLYSSELSFQQLFIAWAVQVMKSKSFVEIIDERINSKNSLLINISKLFPSNSKLIIYRLGVYSIVKDHLGFFTIDTLRLIF